MLISVFDNMSLCTEAEVQRMLPLVSEQRRAEALRYKHTFGQFACLKSYLMLTELLGAISPTLDYQTPSFAFHENGKPYLAERPDICFNISHTRNAILVAISSQEIGVDIEQFRSPSAELLAKTMNPTEQAEIASSPDSAEAFTSFWTRKEAVLKLRGTGIVDDLHTVLSGTEYTETHVNRKKGYAFTIALPAPPKINGLR